MASTSLTNLGQFEVPYGLQNLNLTEAFRDVVCRLVHMCVCLSGGKGGQEGETGRKIDIDPCVSKNWNNIDKT